MARARNIKPGFFTNDVLAELPALTRLLFAGLWTIADREGRLEDRPKKIKAEVLPYDECDPDAMLEALQASGFIRRYTAAGKAVVQILAWDKHQNPHVKEAASTLPEMGNPDASTEQAPDKHSASTVQAPDEDSKAGQPEPERAGLIPDSGFLIPDSNAHPGAAAPAPAGAFVRPEWIPADTWAAYLKTRTGKKAKNEPHALGLIVKDLEAFRAKGHDPITVLNNSIKGGWAGVFEPKTAPQDVRAATVPSAGPDPELERIKAHKGAPIPAAVKEKLAALKGGILQ